MRNLVLLPFVAILSLAGCQVDQMDADLSDSIEQKLVIRATYESPDIDTKTMRDGSGKIYWVPGDAISLFYGSGTAGGSKFVAMTDTVALVTNFSGTITAVTGGADIDEGDTFFWGLYPYDPTASCDGRSVTMTIPATQPGKPDTFESGYAPSLGHSQGLMLSFRNIWSGFGFTVSEAGFQSVTFRGNGGECLVGKAKIGLDSNGLPKVEQIVEGLQEVTLTAPDATGFIPGKKV